MNTPSTAAQRLLSFLQSGRDITVAQAQTRFNIVNVPARIAELRKAGYAVYLNENEVASHLDNAKGATHDCKGLDGGWKFNIKRLSDVLNFATHADWTSSKIGVYFQADNIRAMLARVGKA